MQQKICCREFTYDIMTRYLHYGQRITFDTNLDEYDGLKCDFEHGDKPCNKRAVYVVTLTAKYEIPPFPHSLKRLTKNVEDFKAEFLK